MAGHLGKFRSAAVISVGLSDCLHMFGAERGVSQFLKIKRKENGLQTQAVLLVQTGAAYRLGPGQEEPSLRTELGSGRVEVGTEGTQEQLLSSYCPQSVTALGTDLGTSLGLWVECRQLYRV